MADEASQEERHGTSTTAGPEQEEPDFDKGLKAWVQVLGAFFLWFNSWGIVNTFGVFQTYYEEQVLSNTSPSSISWIGSIQSFLLLFVGVITGPLFDAGYFHVLLPVGSFIIVFGYMMTSLATEYYQVMLAQGICVGIGTGCLFVPSAAIMPQYFKKRKALANGIAATGSSIGGVIYPIMFYKLQQTAGFAWATRSLAFVALGTCAISIGVMRVRFTPKQKRALWQPSAFKELPYTIFCLAMFISFLGYYSFLFYIQPWAIDNVTNENTAFYLLPILNVASTFGRVLPNFFADIIGPFNVLFPIMAITAIIAFCWIAVDSLAGTIVLVILYGFVSGGFVTMPVVVIASMTKDMSSYGTRMGMSLAIVAVALLIGTPIGGAIVNGSNNYLGVQFYCGTCLAISAVIVVFNGMLLRKDKITHRTQ